MMPSRFSAAAGALVVALFGSPSVADVISDWNSAVAPPPPELKEVTVDPSTTALLFLDIMKGNCTARPRCVAAMPNLKRLHDEARAHNMVVWYSLVGSNGKATPDDIIGPRYQTPRGRMVSPARAGQIHGLDSRANSQASRHQDRDRLRQLIPGGDRRYGFRRGAARLQSHRSGRLLGGRGRLSRTIRGVPSSQGRPSGSHQQCDNDAQRHGQILNVASRAAYRMAC
jgi:hypothetical protein